MRTRATVGMTGDFKIEPGEAGWVQVLGRALAEGYRWLVLIDELYEFNSPLFLSNYNTDRHLRLEGGGPGVTTIRRAAGFSNGSLIYSGAGLSPDQGWRVHFTGLTFDGNGGQGSNFPNVDMRRLELSSFENCAFVQSGGDGASFGSGGVPPGHENRSRLLRFMHCTFAGNPGNGVNVDHAAEILFIGGSVMNNGQLGLYWNAASNAGGAAVMGTLFEGNASYSLWLQNAAGVRVMNCLFRQGTIRLQTTGACMFENNELRDGAVFSNNGVNTVDQFNVTVT
jgi:hypothetical protein